MDKEHTDFLAIGGGIAGFGAATAIATVGRKVMLADPGTLGGLCSLRGCNPKKILVRASEVLAEAQHARTHGVEAAAVRIHWDKVVARRRGFTDPVPAASEAMLRDRGIEWLPSAPTSTPPTRTTSSTPSPWRYAMASNASACGR